MAQIHPWISDAADLNLAEEVDDFRTKLFLETFPIKQFLDPSREYRDTKFIVSAPKGYGKTLLVKAKRLSLQDSQSGILLLPENMLVDRPGSTLPILNRIMLDRKSTDPQYWKKVWLMAICLGCFHAYDRKSTSSDVPLLATVGNGDFVGRLASAQTQQTIIDVFNSILHLTDAEFFQLERDSAAQIIPAYRAITRPIAIFLDNIDEYFDPLQSQHIGSPVSGDPVIYLNQNRQVWVMAQMGLAETIRELHGINRHVKIFASLRKEAILRGQEFSPTGLQVQGICVELRYTKDELREIFIKNIRLLRRGRLRNRRVSDPIAQLVGEENIWVENTYTHRTEEFFDFLFRHTLGRPRDLMVMGEKISSIDPEQRVASTLKMAVYEAAKDIVTSYTTEMSPFVPIPRVDLYKLITQNVLTLPELVKIVEQYAEAAKINGYTVNEHPFCSLFRLGLLGIPKLNEETGGVLQFFSRPDELRIDRNENILPPVERFFIHPALDDMINDYHGSDYKRHFHTTNIIGNGLMWDDSVEKFVLIGDIVEYGQLMEDVEYATVYPNMFREFVESICRDLEVRTRTDGDKLILVDGSPVKLINAARLLVRRMATINQWPRQMRFGGSRGVVDFWETDDGKRAPSGRPLKRAARLEPLAQPNSVLITERFALGLREATRLELPMRELEPKDLPALPYSEGRFTVQKRDSDPPLIGKLFLISL